MLYRVFPNAKVSFLILLWLFISFFLKFKRSFLLFPLFSFLFSFFLFEQVKINQDALVWWYTACCGKNGPGFDTHWPRGDLHGFPSPSRTLRVTRVPHGLKNSCHGMGFGPVASRSRLVVGYWINKKKKQVKIWVIASIKPSKIGIIILLKDYRFQISGENE